MDSDLHILSKHIFLTQDCGLGEDVDLKVLVQFRANISSLRDERLPKGPRFASESLDADTASGSVFSN